MSSMVFTLLPGWLELLFLVYWVVHRRPADHGRPRAVASRSPGCSSSSSCRSSASSSTSSSVATGRSWRSARAGSRRCKRVETEEMAPIYERNAAAAARFTREWARYDRRTYHARHHRRERRQSAAGVRRSSSSSTGAAKFARLKEDLAARAALHPPAVLHLGAGPRSPPRSSPSFSTASRPASRCASCTTGWAASRSRSASSSSSPRAGAIVRADVTDLLRINYRNHRKIVVIDGEIGYTGGMNVGQEYIDGGERFATWRDTHLRLTGQAVAGLEKLYASRWFEQKQRPRGPLRREVHAGARPCRSRDRHARRDRRAGGRRPLERGAARPHGRHRRRRRSRSGSSRRTSCPTTASTTS